MNNDNVLTSGPITRALFQLALPIFCANILQCVSGTVTAILVGRFLGEAALTAVTNAQTIMVLLTGAAFGITTASTVLVGQCMGAGNIAGAKRVVGTGVKFFSALSSVLMLLGFAFATPLLRATGTAPEALPLAVPYVRVMLLALPGMYLFGFVMSLLVGTGDSRTPLRFIVLSVALGVLFTPALIWGGQVLNGAGVIGAALATFTVQALCLVCLLRYLYRRPHPLCLSWQELVQFNVEWPIVREFIHKGIPMGAQVLVMSLSSVLMVALVNRFGVNTTAAFGALMQLWTYILMPGLATAVAVSTIAAQNIGAQNWSRVRQITLIGISYSFVVTAVIVAVVYAAGSYAYRFFLPEDSEALSIASHVNRIVTWSLIFMNIPMVLFGVMRAAGAVMVPLLVHTLSLLIIRYPLAAMLLERWQSDAIWWSFTISIGIDVVLAILYYRYGSWHEAERLQVGGTSPALHVPIQGDRLGRSGSDFRGE